MKPIASVISREALDLMEKAQGMITRIDTLAKAKKCKDCGDGKCNCKDCPECGGKMNKMGCKMGCGGNKMAKGEEGGGSFTIADAQRAKAGIGGKSPPAPVDEKYEDYDGGVHSALEAKIAANESADSLVGYGDRDDRDDNSSSETLPLSEGPSRDQKRGDRNLGVAVKKPGFRSKEPMPLSDASASGRPEEVNAERSRRKDERNASNKKSIFRHMQASRVAKSGDAGSQPTFNTTFSTTPQDIAFVSESGGQTRNAGYSTNQHLLDSEDVANKGATSVSISLEKLASMLNPHEGGGSSRLDDNGVLKSVCEQCGGNQYSGCRGNCPNKKNLN